jgi:hypothetical protein
MQGFGKGYVEPKPVKQEDGDGRQVGAVRRCGPRLSGDLPEAENGLDLDLFANAPNPAVPVASNVGGPCYSAPMFSTDVGDDLRFGDFADTLKELVRHPSVVGAEHSFFRVVQRCLEENGAAVSWYDGLLVAQGSRPASCMFSAHIDRHGLVCTGPNEFQYAAFVAANRSDLLGNSVSEGLMSRVADRFNNDEVMAYEPWSGVYRGRGRIRSAFICDYRKNLIFELDDLEHLVAGTPIAFVDRLSIRDGRFVAQLDNVLTAAALVHLFAMGYQGTAFFTAGEEAGRSWRWLLEWFRRFGTPEMRLIVVDTSPFPDVEAADRQQVVLRHRDANAIFDEALTGLLETGCGELGIDHVYKDEYVERLNAAARARGESEQSLGSTEMGRIAKASEFSVRGTTLQIPTTGYHTVEESAALDSVRAFLKLALYCADRGTAASS